MKKTQKRMLILYILIVILPTIIGGYYLIQEHNNKNLHNKIEEARWAASIHESYWEKFISEAVTSLEMLSLTAKTIYNDLNEMKPLLDRAHQSDPRYSGIYLLNQDGQVLTGSNNYLQDNGLLDADFINEVLHTKDIVISDQQFELSNGQNVIGLSAPIINKNNELIAVMVSLLRVDYIENIMKVLTPDSKLYVLNANDEPLMAFNVQPGDQLDKGKWISIPIESLPWNIKVKVNNPMERILFFEILIIIGLFLVVTHVLFLIILYVLLKRKASIEKQENEVQKLELVGTLAASTAHEIRNPLTGIKGLVQLLSEKYKDPNDQFYFSVINQEIKRINEIVSEFLILGRPTAQNLEIQDLTEVIREIYPLISTEAMIKNILLNCEFPDNPVYVKCAKDQMKQVILNITRNAFEALEHGGTLSIHVRADGNKCELQIIDNGIGIDEDSMEKLFVPFYTSKETGTGLGLVVCQRILQTFDGTIQITSKENKGTKVIITLPVKRSQ